MKIEYNEVKLVLDQTELQLLRDVLELARVEIADKYVGQGMYTAFHGYTNVRLFAMNSLITKFFDTTS